MRIRTFALAAMLLACSTAVAAGQGMVRLASAHDAAATTERLVAALEDKGMRVFSVIDHARGAAEAGLELPPTRVVIFGNPKVGTPLMQCSRTAAIDLPQKMLIWADASGDTWIGYNAAEYVADRHATGPCEGIVARIGKALNAFATAAASP